MNEQSCEWFLWIGSTGCDRCGRPPAAHKGYEWLIPGAGPFGDPKECREQRPWSEIRRIPLMHRVFGDVQTASLPAAYTQGAKP